MRVSVLLLLALAAEASLFGGKKATYEDWNLDEAHKFLNAQGIKYSKNDNLAALQKEIAKHADAADKWATSKYNDVTESMIDSWQDSDLREYLLEYGIISPASTQEQLRLMAKHKASQISSAVAHGQPTPVASHVSSAAEVAASSVSSAASYTARKLDDAKDYVFSSWSDDDLTSWLRSHNVLPEPAPTNRHDLLAHVRDAYAKLNGAVYKAWSDSYLHEWLVNHGIIPPAKSARDKLLELMEENYYDVKDKVYSSWDTDKLRDWLVSEGVLTKTSAQLKREKYLKLMDEHYSQAKSTAWHSWRDSDMRSWLIKHGYMKSDAQMKREELTDLMNEKYNEASANAAPYLTWPDARLRAKLRSYGVDDKKIVGRDNLLQEMRVHYVEGEGYVNSLFGQVHDVATDAFDFVNNALHSYLGINLLKLNPEDALERGKSSVSSYMAKQSKRAHYSAQQFHASANSAYTAASNSAEASASSAVSSLEASANSASSSLSSAASSASVAMKQTPGVKSLSEAHTSASKALKTQAADIESSAHASASSIYAVAHSRVSQASKDADVAMSSISASAVSVASSANKYASTASKSLSSVYSVASKSASSLASVASASAASAKAEL